jgi:hypothetical protein
VRHLVGSAAAWGGNPDKDAIYLNITPANNDGKTIYKLNVKAVPVEAFWSVSLYDAKGYYEKNPYDAYTINNITAKKESDGGVAIQFGGCDGKISNCLPIMAGWNYTVRLLSSARANPQWQLEIPGRAAGELTEMQVAEGPSPFGPQRSRRFKDTATRVSRNSHARSNSGSASAAIPLT